MQPTKSSAKASLLTLLMVVFGLPGLFLGYVIVSGILSSLMTGSQMSGEGGWGFLFAFYASLPFLLIVLIEMSLCKAYKKLTQQVSPPRTTPLGAPDVSVDPFHHLPPTAPPQ